MVFNGFTVLEIRINGLKVPCNPTMRTIEASIIYISMSFSFLYVVQQICNVMGVRVGSRFVFWQSQTEQIINILFFYQLWHFPDFDIYLGYDMPSCDWERTVGAAGQHSSQAPDPTSIYMEIRVAVLWICICLMDF